jgi:hypothetical protein
MSEITIGILREEHAEELRVVAERDSREVPVGSVLGARVDGRLVAARSIGNGHAVADPFVHTAEIQKLLAQRESQIRGKGHRGLLGRIGMSRSSDGLPAAAGDELLQV